MRRIATAFHATFSAEIDAVGTRNHICFVHHPTISEAVFWTSAFKHLFPEEKMIPKYSAANFDAVNRAESFATAQENDSKAEKKKTDLSSQQFSQQTSQYAGRFPKGGLYAQFQKYFQQTTGVEPPNPNQSLKADSAALLEGWKSQVTSGAVKRVLTASFSPLAEKSEAVALAFQAMLDDVQKFPSFKDELEKPGDKNFQLGVDDEAWLLHDMKILNSDRHQKGGWLASESIDTFGDTILLGKKDEPGKQLEDMHDSFRYQSIMFCKTIELDGEKHHAVLAGHKEDGKQDWRLALVGDRELQETPLKNVTYRQRLQEEKEEETARDDSHRSMMSDYTSLKAELEERSARQLRDLAI